MKKMSLVLGALMLLGIGLFGTVGSSAPDGVVQAAMMGTVHTYSRYAEDGVGNQFTLHNWEDGSNPPNFGRFSSSQWGYSLYGVNTGTGCFFGVFEVCYFDLSDFPYALDKVTIQSVKLYAVKHEHEVFDVSIWAVTEDEAASDANLWNHIWTEQAHLADVALNAATTDLGAAGISHLEAIYAETDAWGRFPVAFVQNTPSTNGYCAVPAGYGATWRKSTAGGSFHLTIEYTVN